MRELQRGTAIIFVLTILAILAPLLTKLLFDQRLLSKKLAVGTHYNNAYLYALSGETFARQVMMEQADNLNTLVNLSKNQLPLPIDGGRVGLRLHDLQGRININNLEGEQTETFQRVLRDLWDKQGVEPNDVDVVLGSIRDWVDTDSDTRNPYGAEDNTYMTLERPYRAANRLIRSISELRLVYGVTDEIWQKISPGVIALPETNLRVNINEASEAQLQVLLPPEAEPAISLFVQAREDGFVFKSIEEFISQYEQAVGSPPDEDTLSLIDVKSNYFLAEILAEFGDGQVRLQSILRRVGEEDVRVLYRSFGEL